MNLRTHSATMLALTLTLVTGGCTQKAAPVVDTAKAFTTSDAIARIDRDPYSAMEADMSKSLIEQERRAASSNGILLPVSWARVESCTQQFDSQVCAVHFRLGNREVGDHQAQFKKDTGYVSSMTDIPNVMDLRLHDCAMAGAGQVKCAIEWHYAAWSGLTFFAPNCSKQTREHPEIVQDTITFTAYQAKDGAYVGKLGTDWVKEGFVDKDGPQPVLVAQGLVVKAAGALTKNVPTEK